MISTAFETSPSPIGRWIGTAFVLLALFAGLLGGSLASPFFHLHPSPGLKLSHGLMMTFFIICPAALGGFGTWFLPAEVGATRMALPRASVAGLVFLIGGVVFLPLVPLTGLMLWALGMTLVATDIIATVLEQRTIAFCNLPPLAWSFLATACGLIVTAPVLVALISRAIWFGSQSKLETGINAILAAPEAALMLAPALGLVVSMLVHPRRKSSFMHRVAPYVFGTVAMAGPLYWAHMLFNASPGTGLKTVMLLTQVLPCVILVFALCRDVWSQSVVLNAVTPWAFASLVMFGGGWISFPFGHDIAHSAAAFGSVLALCGGFYGWLCSERDVRRFVWIGQVHAVLTATGSLLSLIPLTASLGGILMGLSLFGFGILGIVMLHEASKPATRISAPAHSKS